MVEPHTSNFRVIITNFLSVQKLRIITVMHIIKPHFFHCKWHRIVLAVSTDARKLAAFDIPTRDNIHRYPCNSPIIQNITKIKSEDAQKEPQSIKLLKIPKNSNANSLNMKIHVHVVLTIPAECHN